MLLHLVGGVNLRVVVIALSGVTEHVFVGGIGLLTYGKTELPERPYGV
ncbi:hypothetical protein Krac_10908 [Ktedonobacter racemifer DSM 44963]|uniref:Uncharacterized protein n=1 Tax=Ktedonobacter racemifer DSM 44963 TaxID=485913 RepID=D6TIV1_KTERA|nr:hypothetical protein Krac_10908 [Ktedonobacter racemifer DSM 44963]